METDDRGEVQHGVVLGRWAKQRRLDLGLTQEDIAVRMGVAPNWVTHLETGRRRRMLPQPQLGALADALEVRVEDLLRVAGVLPNGRAGAARRPTTPEMVRLTEMLREEATDDEVAQLIPIIRGILRMTKRDQ